MTKQRRTLRTRVTVTLVAGLVLGLTACGGSNYGGDSGSGDSTFVYAAAAAPGQLDIWTTYEGESSRINGFEWGSTLVEYDGSDADTDPCDVLVPSSSLRGNLAESWEYSADKSQLLITLREGVKSADGNVLTSEDVVWSFTRAMKQSTIVEFLAVSVAQFDPKQPFEVVDERTVAANVVTPTALDMAVFTWPQFNVLDSTEVKKHATDSDPWANEWLQSNIATFGPWQLDSFTPSQEVVYTRNPNFWNDDIGNIERLIVKAVPDASTRLQLLESGSVDYAEKLAFDQYAQVSDSDTAKLIDCASPNRDTLMLNQQVEAFADPNVRQAISFAMDREALTSGVYKGFARPATTGVSDVYWEPGDDVPTFGYDTAEAERLLSEAGVDDLSFAIMASPTRPGGYAQSLAIQIQSMLEEVGVETEIDMVPGATEFSDKFFASEYDAIIYTEPPAVGDPFYSLNLYNSTESFQNTFGYDDPEYDTLTEQIQVTEPGPDRDQLLAEVSTVVAETTPQVYLTDTRWLHALNQSVEGYENSPNGSLLVYHLSK